jgi:hypothetical protein
MTVEGSIRQGWNKPTNDYTSLQFDDDGEDYEYMLNVHL